MPQRYAPDYWQSRADEARAMADQFRDPEQKKIMLGIAQGYEQMARAAERLRQSATILDC
jgi:hypothetical protein